MTRASLGPLGVVVLLLLSCAGCGDDRGNADAAAPLDLGIPDVGAALDGPPLLRGVFTISGCSTLDTSTGQPRCSGRAPLSLTFVPLGSGVDTFVWTFAGGDPATSKTVSPVVTFGTPGTYPVMLAAGGSAGTTTANGVVVVSAGATGSACLDDTDCDAGAGLFCVCKPGELGCAGALAIGLCARTCSGSVCSAGEICSDFTRGGAYVPSSGSDGGVAAEVWRRALCVPACTTAAQCRAGLACRDLPALSAGATAGGVYSWKKGCFATVGGDDGDACRSPDGVADPSRCLSGRCDDYGARGLCSSPCTTSSDCPPTAGCATYNGPPATSACVRRCDATAPCTADPLLDCEAANQVGGLGFSVTPSESPSVRFCAPLRCTMASQCAPSGSCTPMGGGSFCLHN
ncbi:MAG: domain containing protein [Myxococcales bacterium]|nr:domain containing protein [Myxococcales bacterium]